MRRFLYLSRDKTKRYLIHAPSKGQAAAKLARLKPDWILDLAQLKEVSK